MTERKQRENSSVRQERRPLRLPKVHKQKTGEGEGKGALSKNLVYTKRQKDFNEDRKHKTTNVIHQQPNCDLLAEKFTILFLLLRKIYLSS